MPTYWKRSLTIAGALAVVILLDEWLAIYTSALPARLALVFALALVAGRLWKQYAASRGEPPVEPTHTAAAAHAATADARMLAEITTALEHLRSVGVLLEISETHRQPIPEAVPLNLGLVIKHLDKARRGFSVREHTIDFRAGGPRAGVDRAQVNAAPE